MTVQSRVDTRRESVRLRPGGLGFALGAVLAIAVGVRAQSDWTIPEGAATLTSPVVVTADVVEKGGEIFKNRCRKCHGPEGKGNGPYADPKHLPADLTQAEVGATPDGVLFYKIWNGLRPMPAFKTDLEKNDVWTVIAFVKTLAAAADKK